MARYTDLSGKTFGQLQVESVSHFRGENKNRRVFWNCKCNCGKTKAVRSDWLTTGAVISCGCVRKERSAQATKAACTKHGMVGTPTYRSWSQMKVRCTDPSNHKFPDYGGRGIQVCERWKDFALFLEDMGVRPDGTSIDRIDVNGNYEPGNCRWADAKTQRNNRRDSLEVQA